MSLLPAERAAPLALPEGAARLLRDLIHEHTGFFFEPDRLDMMLDKISPLAQAHGCRSFMDYYYHLKFDGFKTGEWQRVMDALSVQETYFWRELDQIRALVDILVPQWFAQTSKPLRIWSAASATGEELLSIAMALDEAGWLEKAPFELVGSDASTTALEKATRGVYRERSFRSLPPELQKKHFTQAGHSWAVSDRLKSRVRFVRANIVRPDEIAALASSPVIFCRNVFIYFSPDAIRRTVGIFAAHMPPGGHLFVGACESLVKLTNDFALQELGAAFTYVRKSSPANT